MPQNAVFLFFAFLYYRPAYPRSSRPGSLLLTGSTTPLHRQPLDAREKIFQGMRTSRLAPLRLVSRILLLIFKRAWTALSPSIPGLLGLSTRSSVHLKRADGTAYEFVQFSAATSVETEPPSLDADVVIVGSGCGGSVAAKNLAEAGFRVVVVEKSYYFPTSAFPMTPLEGNMNLYENGGFLATDDGNMAVLAGSTWGGGGTINWSASLAPQGYLREEWAAKHGLDLFTSRQFQESVDRVCDRMGVDDSQIEHSFGNQLVLNAAQKLGYNARPVPQNTGHGKHYCGHCHLGCASAMKKGPRETFLADAAESGAVFIEGFDAHRVILGQSGRSGNPAAVGIAGTWTSRAMHFGHGQESGPLVRRRVEIRAKRVIVACGSLQSPLLLRRSGMRNPHIGRHLYLHPGKLKQAEGRVEKAKGICSSARIRCGIRPGCSSLGRIRAHHRDQRLGESRRQGPWDQDRNAGNAPFHHPTSSPLAQRDGL
jgi:hypothetical protein